MKNNLTKENFWNEVFARYPKACKIFCDWIDKYKLENNWSKIFNQGKETRGGYTTAPKFHEIPYAMQQGIWIEFAQEINSEFFEQSEYSIKLDLEEDIYEVLSQIEQCL